MARSLVSIQRYTTPFDSVRRTVELAGGLPPLPAGAKVVIKPNIVFWTRAVAFPKWGVITTSRVVQDMVRLLKDHGIDDITIAEGTVTADPRDHQTPAHAFDTLGYQTLRQRYGIKVVNVFERPFEPVDLGDGIRLKFNTDALASDLIVDLPVLKSHNQTVVSLGIKNLKGLIDIASRKKCHSADPEKDLHFMVARLADGLPPVFCLIDGIFSLERGPGPDGRARRSELLIAASDVLAADQVGARVLGYPPDQVPYLVHAAGNHVRPLDGSDIEVTGEAIEDVAARHAYDFPYAEKNNATLPLPMIRQKISGIHYHKFDTTMCTYCSGINGLVLTAIHKAWKGEAFGNVEVLTGKKMAPRGDCDKTILLGKCIYQAHKDNPQIKEMIAVKSCPPKTDDILAALKQAGIDADDQLFEQTDQLPGMFMQRYLKRAEFEEDFFRIS